MNRKTFIKTCSLACLGGGVLSTILQSCAGTKMVHGTISGENIELPLTEFNQVKNGETVFRKYVVLQNEQLQYPICVYRISDNEYKALLMKCTHQGNELSVFGDKLHCAAHGSEFDKQGLATIGPAVQPLRNFPITIENQKLLISLKAS
jgi:Rieske Fe-S protein